LTQLHSQVDTGRVKRIALRILTVLGNLVLAVVGVGIAYVIGQQVQADQWALLVSLVGVGTYVVIALINPKHAFMVWLVTAPFARFVYLNIELGRGIPDLSLNRVMTGVLLIIILASAAVQQRRLVRLVWPDALLILFALGAMASVPTSTMPLKTALQSFFDLVLIPIAVYFVARNLLTTRDDIRHLIYALIFIGAFLGFLAAREQITGVVWFYPEDRSLIYSGNIRRVVGLMGNPACMALSLCAIIPWGWYAYLHARRGRTVLLLLVALMMAGCYFCMNRSGWAGLALGLICLALFVKRFRRIFMVLLVIAVIVAGVYWAVIVSSTVVERRLKAQGPVEYRMQTWEVAARMLRSHLLFGVGYENFGGLYKQYSYWDANAPVTPYPHNTYLWIMLMGGLAAFGPFALFLLVTAVSALRSLTQAAPGGLSQARLGSAHSELAGVFLASMAAVFVPALVGDIFQCYYMMMIVFTILGALMAVVTGHSPDEVAVPTTPRTDAEPLR
jgi:O-antigen ligase